MSETKWTNLQWTAKWAVRDGHQSMSEDLYVLCEMRRRVQTDRIRTNNRIEAIKRGDSRMSEQMLTWLQEEYSHYMAMEHRLTERIRVVAKDHPMIARMCRVPGVGPVLAAMLYSLLDIYKAPHISSFWKYCGMGVAPDGKADRLQRGTKANFNRKAKQACYLIAMSILKAHGRRENPYGALYYKMRDQYSETRPGWTEAHVHYAALRYMIKRFLAHLWLVWREEEGLQVHPPYVQARLGHTHIDSPAEYGWYADGEYIPPEDDLYDDAVGDIDGL